MTALARSLLPAVAMLEALWLGVWLTWGLLLAADSTQGATLFAAGSWAAGQALLLPLLPLAALNDRGAGSPEPPPRSMLPWWALWLVLLAAWALLAGVFVAILDASAIGSWLRAALIAFQGVPLALTALNLRRGRLGRVPGIASAATLTLAIASAAL